jgi:hypothetical protein
MDARWKIEHVKLDVPPDYLLFKNQKLGWASVSLVRFSSILFLAYQLIPTRARNASRAFAAKCCGAAQLHCASNLYIYIFFIIYIYICFQTLQCQSVEWYSTTGTTQLFQPAARPHGQELQNSFLAIRLQEWLVTGCYWLILAVVDPVGKLFGLLF